MRDCFVEIPELGDAIRRLTVRCSDKHGREVLQLIFVERQLILVPSILQDGQSLKWNNTQRPCLMRLSK